MKFVTTNSPTSSDEIKKFEQQRGIHGKTYIRAHNSPPNDQILIDDTGFQDEDDYEEAQIFFPVADSFSEFVAMLGPDPSEA